MKLCIFSLQHDAQMDFLGTKLATCSCDKTVRVFDVNINHGSQTFVAELKGHEGPVSLYFYKFY